MLTNRRGIGLTLSIITTTSINMDKLLRRLGLKDDYGYCDTSIVGFIVIWSAFGYMIYVAIGGIIERIVG